MPIPVAKALLNETGAPATPDDELTLTLRVAGGAHDHYRVFGDDPSIAGCCRISTGDPQASPAGEGNLLARAEAGTIDPTQAAVTMALGVVQLARAT